MRVAAPLTSGGEGLVEDAEVRKFTGESPPARLDLVDTRSAGALLRPAVQLPDAQFLALGEDLDRAVGTVAHPAGQPQSACLALRGSPEKDALDTATDLKLYLLERHLG